MFSKLFKMGNQYSVEGKKDAKSTQPLAKGQRQTTITSTPTSPTKKEGGLSVTDSVPFALFEAPSAQNRRSRQSLREAIRSELLAPKDSSNTKQNDFGLESIDLATAISLLQRLKKTASPDELAALREYIPLRLILLTMLTASRATSFYAT